MADTNAKLAAKLREAVDLSDLPLWQQIKTLDATTPMIYEHLSQIIAALEATEGKAEACGDRAVNSSWIPCMLNQGHQGPHWSTSGCAGGQVAWGSGVSS